MQKLFGDLLRSLRIKAGFSLREFAKLVGMQPSNLSLLENNKANPPRDNQILFKLAAALELKKDSEDWNNFFDLAVQDIDKIPPDILEDENIREYLPIMLRTIANTKPSANEILELIRRIREERDTKKANNGSIQKDTN